MKYYVEYADGVVLYAEDRVPIRFYERNQYIASQKPMNYFSLYNNGDICTDFSGASLKKISLMILSASPAKNASSVNSAPRLYLIGNLNDIGQHKKDN